VDFLHVLRAFSKGADGVFIGGCHFSECHYITNGNYSALGTVLITKAIMEQIGLNPDRLRIESMSAGEGIRFAEVMNEFNGQINSFGPLGQSEGLTQEELQSSLAVVTKLVPYIKLVERERLRMPVQTDAADRACCAGEEFKKVFEETIKEKLIISHLVAILGKTPLTTSEIAGAVGLTPSEVSRYLISSSRQRFIKFDESQKRYALA
jgi:coenzyme F420-reducing hydrogenase delta subunit